MTTKDIIKGINEYLTNDIDYKLFSKENTYGSVSLVESVSFDITNKKPDTYRSPYYQIQSIDQAKDIFQNVFPTISKVDIDKFFSDVISTKNIDFSQDLFFSIFRSDNV